MELLMSFQWLQMRIQEERDRRQREAQILERLPGALQEVHDDLSECIQSYVNAFGEESAVIELSGSAVQISIRYKENGGWAVRSKVEISIKADLPGFHIHRGEVEPLSIQVGILSGDKVFYRDGDEYIGMDELSRRILDRAFFPKLST